MSSIANPGRTYHPKPCQGCGAEFQPTNATAAYCSAGDCRAERKRAKAERAAEAHRLKKAEEREAALASPTALLKIAFRDCALAAGCDRPRSICSADVRHRFEMWVEAREATFAREKGADAAYRASLLELAAAALRVAAECPPADDISPVAGYQVAAVNKLVPDVEDLDLPIAA